MSTKHRDCTFSFTPELVLDAHLTGSLAFLSDVKDFVKERADLEREFGKKLDALAKKHAARNEKRALFTKGSLVCEKYEDPTGSLHNSVEKAWNSIIQATESRSEAHFAYAESLNDRVCEKLKNLASKKDDARKKARILMHGIYEHMNFSQRLTAERDEIYADKDKAKKKYDDACEAVENIKAKYDRASDDKTREKLKLAWHQEILDMNNKKIWQSFALIDEEFIHSTSTNITSELKPLITSISPKHDTEVFIHLNPQTAPDMYQRLTPKDFVIVPSVMWRDSVEMASDEFSRCYMVNTLHKLRKKLQHVERDLSVKTKGIEGMELLYDVYMKNPEQGDMEDTGE
ncbi:hypothetical protein HDU98_011805 [Podochytrium sp. JEL0797]|nr:hypothetical protein HDU98_011805 [Podochytrium sp. JEL0797]